MLRHQLLVLVAALAAPPPPEPSVGVCWTRNKVNHRPPKARKRETAEHLSSSELRNLVLSAASLKRRSRPSQLVCSRTCRATCWTGRSTACGSRRAARGRAT